MPITIMHAIGGQWQTLFGHDCFSLEEADRYVAMLAPDGGMYVVRAGQEAPPCPQPTPKAPLFPNYDQMTPEQQANLREGIGRVLRTLGEP